MRRSRRGGSILNRLINSLPVELHIPGYRFCGPGTRLKKRLARGDRGINPLDESCRAHDIAYSNFKNLDQRHKADAILAQEALRRAHSSDASFGERLAARAVASAMNVKTKLGMGVQRKKRISKNRSKKRSGGKISFRKFIRKAANALKKKKPDNIFRAARLAMSELKGKKKQPISPRVIPIPKTGGFLPLIPLFAGLSALGALSGGAAGIAKAVNDAKAAQRSLNESERHNKVMEAIALGKGLFLKPYKKGLGLYLTDEKKNSR